MTLTKSISAQENLNKHIETENSLTDCISFSDFDKLILLGEQKLLTFGEYCQKNSSDKNKRQKIINYFYKKLYSKL